MTVAEAQNLLLEMHENHDQSLTGMQVAALSLATVVLGALPPKDVKTVDVLFANYFD